MSLPKVRKKPTAKELAGVIIEVNNKAEHSLSYLHQLDNVLGLYIEFKEDSDAFNQFVEKKQKEIEEKNVQEANGKTDSEDISSNSGNKGTRPKRVRKKSK